MSFCWEWLFKLVSCADSFWKTKQDRIFLSETNPNSWAVLSLAKWIVVFRNRRKLSLSFSFVLVSVWYAKFNCHCSENRAVGWFTLDDWFSDTCHRHCFVALCTDWTFGAGVSSYLSWCFVIGLSSWRRRIPHIVEATDRWICYLPCWHFDTPMGFSNRHNHCVWLRHPACFRFRIFEI